MFEGVAGGYFEDLRNLKWGGLMAFVKINRNIVNSKIFNDDKLLSFYVRLILLCRVKPGTRNNVEVARGQLLTTIRDLGAVLDLPTTNTFRLLSSLEQEQLISVTKCPRGSIITVNDYDCLVPIIKNAEQQKSCSLEQSWNNIEGSTLFNKNKKNVKNGVQCAREQKSIFDNSTENGAIKNADSGEEKDPLLRQINCEDKKSTERTEEKSPELQLPSRKSLVEKYGEENVYDYECRFERWRSRQKKPVSITCYEAIERWMRDDNVQKKHNEGAFNTEEIMRRIMENYNR